MQRIPALDGLRAVAIAMVVGYHVDEGLFPAGHWGVILFFVLSGFLVTRLLAAEQDRVGGIDLKAFYLKRALRLTPPLLLVCIAAPLATDTDWSQVVPPLAHYANYARIDGFQLGLLTHTWFLSVLAHFYLVWPLVIIGIPARYRRHAITALLILAAAWRVIAIGVASPGWVYNATDTNAVALLAGCWLAVSRPREWRLAGWSVPALLGLMLLPVFGDTGAGILWGGFVATVLSTIVIHYALTRPAWLEHRIVLWFGTISYSLYLWHYLFVRSEIPTWIALCASVVAAAATWYLVEQPIQRHRPRVVA